MAAPDAAALRQSGNDAFRLGNNEEACRMYSEAIDACGPDDRHTLLGNRCVPSPCCPLPCCP